MSGLPVHGGNVAAVARRYGVDATTLMDFSANINPAGPAPGIARTLARIAGDPGILAPYPEPTGARLREIVARRHNVDAAQVVIANGGAALIDAALRTVPAAHAVLPVPAFSEYSRALAAAGIIRIPVPLGKDFALDVNALDAAIAQNAAAYAILTNPHNPSGLLTSRAAMRSIVDRCRKCGAIVLLDEAFMDFEPAESLLEEESFENLIVLRSLTKFYGMAGVRIGYAVTSAALASAMRQVVPSWPAGTIEQAIAMELLQGDPVYEDETRRNNAVERCEFAKQLAAVGLSVVPSSANFLLVELPVRGVALDAVLERLVREHGIVVRDCRDYDGLESRGFIRVAVRQRAENARLLRALRELLGLARKDP